MRFNYIIAGGTAGYYRAAYSDVCGLDNVMYYSSYIDGIQSKFKRFLVRANFNIKLNRFLKTPLRKIVNPWLFPNRFGNKNLCFLFFECEFAVLNSDYPAYLRRRYPGAKLVLYMQDVVSSLPYYDMGKYKKEFDLILSYDKGDCRRYGLQYYPTPYSKLELKATSNERIDVFFCGASKDRYNEIIDAYKKCTEEGLKCKFFITDVPSDKQIVGDGLIYNKTISYKENLSYVAQSKCILEIMQKGANGNTFRLWEAIMYDKHLLTNNTDVVESRYYSPDFVHIVNESVPISGWIDKKVVIPASVKCMLSPTRMLEFIEQTIV